MTKVSVVLCTYDDADILTDAIASILCQSLPPEEYELVVVDDGSSDRTRAVVQSFEPDDRIRYVRNERNRGLVLSANRGLKMARGEFVTRLDADDAFAPSTLETLLSAAKTADTDFVYADRYETQHDTGETTYVETGDPLDVFQLIAIGTLFRRDRATAIGGYRDFFWEEYDFYVRYLRTSNADPVYVSQPLVVYAQHEESMTADDKRVRDGWDELVTEWRKETLTKYGTLPSYISDNES